MFYFVNSILGLCKVDTFNMKGDWDDINKEETDYRSIDFDEKLRRDTCHSDNKTDKNSCSNINDILDSDITGFVLPENTKETFSL